jgi:predicted RNA binding protein YcfA (HicA-like mRNA interferase family)
LPPLRPLPYREVKRKLEAAGFVETSQKGSHVKFVKTTQAGVLTAIVPQHREVTPGTLRSVLRQAALTDEEFGEL